MTDTPHQTTADRTATYALGVISHHEAAHAVIALRLGGTVPKIRMWKTGPARWFGNVAMTFPSTNDGNRAAATALLAGAPTELHWLDLHGVPATALPHDVHASSAHDRNEARDCLAHITRAERPTYRQIERDAALLVVRSWDRIERLAARLVDHPRMHHVHA
ncbi:hypothetical protein F4560_008712 [Saccharothrix ecbatanensis]|uniref:Peptidase M50B-like protein n=1 Tax=Saccharothrix ecbatanensis TaxID=1105145 RepID=A0A7W9HVU6_9PSEU|nr:hypothetical protein [Saccharothrix ecbatanensis]MBB5808944.1 hypothetical protein [Saccharothrix ecbatanensis]